jgi:hypothetical protein
MSFGRFEEMTQKEKDEFSAVCNKLMSVTYILRDGADGRISKDYRFIESNFDLIYDYFQLCGWKLYKDIQYGVIYVRNTDGYNRLTLNKLTTVMLITMRFIYEEFRSQASISNDVCITVGALFVKIVNEFSIYPKKPSQKEIKDSFRILEAHNLIQKLDESFEDVECRFVILPSILIAVPNEKCKTICDSFKGEREVAENEETNTIAID